MIARVWKARAEESRVEDYVRHFTEHVAPALATVRGYQASQVLCNCEVDPAEVVVVTWWTSLEAIHGFAGSEIGHAVIDPEARRVLVSCDDRVTHYTVVAEHARR
jgi:heme-degrading monooxygenase HmoA